MFLSHFLGNLTLSTVYLPNHLYIYLIAIIYIIYHLSIYLLSTIYFPSYLTAYLSIIHPFIHPSS